MFAIIFDGAACIYDDDPVSREIYETYLINTLRPPSNSAKVFTYTPPPRSQYRTPEYNQRLEREREESLRRSQAEFDAIAERWIK